MLCFCQPLYRGRIHLLESSDAIGDVTPRLEHLLIRHDRGVGSEYASIELDLAGYSSHDGPEIELEFLAHGTVPSLNPGSRGGFSAQSRRSIPILLR